MGMERVVLPQNENVSYRICLMRKYGTLLTGDDSVADGLQEQVKIGREVCKRYRDIERLRGERMPGVEKKRYV